VTVSPKVIQSNFEYLKKLFIMPDSPDKFIEFGNDLLGMIHDFFQEKGGIHSTISLPELSEIFRRTSLPEEPQLIKDVVARIKTEIVDHSVKVGSPYYIGHMTSAVPYFMILIEMIIAALNQNQVKIETAKASSFVERELVAWLHRLVFDKPESFYRKFIQDPAFALGNVTSDGTLANFTALLVAREKAFPVTDDFQGVRAEGMASALKHYGYSRAVVIMSSRAHYSLKKTAGLLGIGEKNIVTVPVDASNRINIASLRRVMKRFAGAKGSERAKIVSVVGIAGNTETGNIDDLSTVGDLCMDAGVHFHVDACWGGPALLVDDYHKYFEGIKSADSVTIDAHKLLYCPLSMGVALFRSEKDLSTIKHTSRYIIRKKSVDIGRFTVEGSRPFSALKPWAAIKIIGREGYCLLFKQAGRNTKTLERLLAESENFEMMNEPELFIVNYRFVPKDVLKNLKIWTAALKNAGHDEAHGYLKRIRGVNRLLNSFNIQLHKEMRADDTTFVSRTTLESTRYRPQEIVVLRAVLINPLTTGEILTEILQTHERIGLELWKRFEAPCRKISKGLNHDQHEGKSSIEI
jgi:putative pyridoxal-dependent aspartate 1-decarboxylase